MVTSQWGPANSFTMFTTRWQMGQPAVNTSTFRLSDITLISSRLPSGPKHSKMVLPEFAWMTVCGL